MRCHYIESVGSKTYDGVWFSAYSHDHEPPHVHGEYAGVEVLVDLLPDGKIRKSGRDKSVRPRKAKKSDVRHILSVAAANASELMKLWEDTHGTPS
jgi:hypothetical protein